jgi:5-aminolevulinate synthase
VHIEALTQALVETWKALDLPFSGLVLDAYPHRSPDRRLQA